MSIVTGVVQRHDRVRIFVDGEFWAELDSRIAVEEHGLFEGAVCSKARLKKARLAGEKLLAMNRALSILSYRARSKGELCERLARAGYGPETVTVVVARLGELGYLDDEELARSMTRDQANKKYGPRRIFFNLRRLGVDEEIAREAVNEEFAQRSEYHTALATVRRRYNVEEEGSDTQVRRVYGFLMRRGY
ncbi:MAG: regulatory protein RecX, partial [Rubrobacter sp.]|nr:regulatory protein RecX [Rubrobacter sp.]